MDISEQNILEQQSLLDTIAQSGTPQDQAVARSWDFIMLVLWLKKNNPELLRQALLNANR